MEYCGAGSVLDIMTVVERTLTEEECAEVLLLLLFPIIIIHILWGWLCFRYYDCC